MNEHADASLEPVVALPRPLPGPYAGEPPELAAYRESPGNERTFIRLRRSFRDAEDWRALASLLVTHAAEMERTGEAPSKAAELCMQAYELWIERVKDRSAAAHALARAVGLKPDHSRALSRLRKLYESMSAREELVSLLRFQLQSAPDSTRAAALHVELATLLREHFFAIGEAVQHYERALQLHPGHEDATRTLIELYLRAGASARAVAVIHAELSRTDPAPTAPRAAFLHRSLARIEAQARGNVPGAARHLQAALERVPEDIDALRAFGVLYLGSGKAAEGVRKAADIFYKAAEAARRHQRHDQAIKLLRRSLSLAPDHQQAAAALESTLIDAQDWLALDDLYREWLVYDASAEAVPLMLRRADLLETRLHRREEARQLFEEASRYEPPDGESWSRLEQIYALTGDVYALASLLEARAERMPGQVLTRDLLRTATIYRDDLGNNERAAVFYYKVLEQEPFNAEAFEGYKEHWRRKQNWSHLRALIDYQIDQASERPEDTSPLSDPAFAEEFVELAELCERRLGDIDSALEAWQRMAALHPQDPRPAKAIARIEKRARMWDNMVRVQEAELARTVDPRKRLDILKRLTQVYRDRQVNSDRAIELYREILELSPGDVPAIRALTALYERVGDYHQVSELLRDQYERSRSPTEQAAVLRRLAELWHHELEAPNEAIWACETILSRSPADREALTRLQQLLEEQRRFPELLEALQREVEQSKNKDSRIKLLRRMARITEQDLGDAEQAASVWTELLELLPGNLEVIDKVVSLYESAGRSEELGTLLHKAAHSPQTPEIRQVDYLLRLAHLAESSLDDAELARACFERVLDSRPDHRGALEALVRIYRGEQSWRPLVDVLGRLQTLAETDDDAFRIAWERAELLSELLDDPSAAIEVLQALADTDAHRGSAEIARTLLDLYPRAERHRDAIGQAEVMLLAADDPSARRTLYETIADTWLTHEDDKPAALATYARFVREFSQDAGALEIMAGLQVDVGDHEGALVSLQRRLDLLTTPPEQTATLMRMSEIAEVQIGDGARAIDLVRRGLGVDPYAEDALGRARRLAEEHALWPQLLGIFEQRFAQVSEAGDGATQQAICFEASAVAEERYGDAERAFDWARRAFFAAIEGQRDPQPGEARLRELAAAHRLWNPLLEVLEEDIARAEQRGAIEAGHYDRSARLQQMADVALDSLDDASRGIAYLRRAYQHDPGDPVLSSRLEQTAREHRQWAALIELHRSQLERATDDQERYDACVAIADIYEQEQGEPSAAFEWLERAWRRLREHAPALAQRAIDRLLELSERHALWPQLAEHHLGRASEAFAAHDAPQGLAALREAAEVFDGRLEDPLGALRILATGLVHDPGGDVLRPELRRLSEAIDQARAGEVPPVGALLYLAVLQRLASRARDDDAMLQLLEERAEIRELRLDDPRGAMAEWLRGITLRPDDDQALVELERLAEDGDAWDAFAVLPAWRLERATGDLGAEASLLRRLAQLYEGPLERPEYALRARLEAWRREPELPHHRDELDDTHAAIWRLAEQTGAYHTPPVPKDPLLRPELALPELADLQVWARVGLDPHALLEQRPSPFAARLDVSSPEAIVRTVTEEVSLTGLLGAASSEDDGSADGEATDAPADAPADAAGAPAVVPPSQTMEIEEIEEIDDADLVPLDEDTVTVATATVTAAAPAGPDQAPAAPPPPPRAPDYGLPPIPTLGGNTLPPRARVASAWDEVAAAYASAPTRDKEAQVTVSLVLARLWESGAGNPERAFASYERALLTQPDHPVALQGLQELAERHQASDRLLVAYERLLAEASLPRHVVTQNVRIAALHEARDDAAAAEASYRAVLRVDPRHVESLERLLALVPIESRPADYAEVLAELIDAQREQWPESVLVERSLELTGLLEQRLSRTEDAVEHLLLLVRQCPRHRSVHEALIDDLLALERWQPAIEAMRTALTVIEDDEFRLAQLARAAHVYEQELGLPDRALAMLTQLVDDPAEAPAERLDAALEAQQRLYRSTGRFAQLVETIDRRIERAGDDPGSKIALQIDKARVLQEDLGDREAALEALESLHEQTPDHDGVCIALSRLYRQAERYEDGIALLRRTWQALPPEGERALTLALALAEAMNEEGGDARGAQGVVLEAIEHHPDSPRLAELRIELARALRDPEPLVEALRGRGQPEDILLAAQLVHRQLDDGPRALRLYSRVLADAKRNPDEPRQGARMAAALEGLVGLRVEDGDTDGAMEFMDRQLSEVEGPKIRALLLAEMGRIIYQSTHDVAAARRRFDAALAEDPEHAAAKLGLARLMLETEQFADAERYLTTAVEALALAQRQAELVEGLIILAEVLERTDRSGEAYRRLTAALRHDPDNLEIRAAVVRNRFGAARYRDAVTATEQIEQRIADRPPEPSQRRMVSDTFVLAARSELELKHPTGAFDRYRRAAQLDPDNPEALEPLVELCRQRGAWSDAATHALALARQTEERPQRAQRFVEAARLFFEAAAAGEDPQGEDPPGLDALRTSAMQALRSALDLAEGHEDPLVTRAAWETAFRSTSSRDAVTALRILERLLHHSDIPDDQHHDLLLEGTRLALEAGDRLELAERYALEARQLVPHSSAAVLALAEVFEANDRVPDIEPLVESFLDAREDDGDGDDPKERRRRLSLLRRLAQMQRSQPAKAVATLERASDLDPDALGVDERRELAELYGELDRRDAVALDNHRRLLAQDPLFAPSLAALAGHHADRGELDHAFALYSLLTLVQPAHEAARGFMAAHRAQDAPAESSVNESWIDDVRAPAPPTAGVSEALALLWDSGGPLLSEHLPRIDIPPETRISPMGEGAISGAWAELHRRLGDDKVALVDTRALPDQQEQERPDGARAAGYFHVRGQHPPVIFADGRAWSTDSPEEVRFALGRAIYFTRPDAVFAAGLRRTTLAQLLSSTLQAFHPRHSRRRHHARGEDDPAHRLGQELARKLPMKVSRRLSSLFKAHEDEPFDSRTWRAWVRRCGNRVGLALCGDLRAALRVMNDGDPEPEADQLREWIASDEDLRDLVAFAASPGYVAARRSLGFRVMLEAPPADLDA